MYKLQIIGGTPLNGKVSVCGAKNAALPILAATILTNETCIITNVPELQDIFNVQQLLCHLGATVSSNSDVVAVNGEGISTSVLCDNLVRRIRASVLLMGPLLARIGEVHLSLPGGCQIGARPIDQHLKGFAAMGASITMESGHVYARAPPGGLRGARIRMDMPTVTGTGNLLMAAVLAKGRTVLENAARAPEVTDLAHMLTAMGADILGIGSDTLVINGVNSLCGCEYEVMSDRIMAGTFLAAAAATQGCVTLTRAQPKTLATVLDKLQQAGAQIQTCSDWIKIDMRGRQIRSMDIRTAPYPGFPTDLQPQFVALNSLGDGVATVDETIFENRFMHVPELIKMGANIKASRQSAVVQGVPQLHAASVSATDLRAGAALVVAALSAKGTTVIDNVHHIDRGYEKIEETLTQLGADIVRIQG